MSGFSPNVSPSSLDLPIDVKRDYGASGSSQSTTGSITSGQKTLTLAAAQDFANGQGISVAHAGAASSLTSPTTVTVTPAVAGSSSYSYMVVAFDASGGAPAGTTGSTSTGTAALSATDYNTVATTAVTGGAIYAYYRVSGGGLSAGLIALTTATSIKDTGLAVLSATQCVPAAAPSGALAQFLVTTIASGAGTTTLTLAASATTTATSQNVNHDDQAAWTNAIAAVPTGGKLRGPAGTYNLTQPIVLTAGIWYDLDPQCTIQMIGTAQAAQVGRGGNTRLAGGTIAGNAGSGHGLEVVGSPDGQIYRLSVSDIVVSGHGGDGVYIGGGYQLEFSRVTSINNGGAGFHIPDSSTVVLSSLGQFAFNSCYASGNTGDGFFAETGSNVAFYSGNYEQNDQDGIHLEDTQGGTSLQTWNLFGVHMEGNGTAATPGTGLHVPRGLIGLVASGCFFFASVFQGQGFQIGDVGTVTGVDIIQPFLQNHAAKSTIGSGYGVGGRFMTGRVLGASDGVTIGSNYVSGYDAPVFGALAANYSTVSTTPVAAGVSANVGANNSPRMRVSGVVSASNNTLGDGVTVSIYQTAANGSAPAQGAAPGGGDTLVWTGTYTQEGLASNPHEFPFDFIVGGLIIGDSYAFYITVQGVTAGTATVIGGSNQTTITGATI